MTSAPRDPQQVLEEALYGKVGRKARGKGPKRTAGGLMLDAVILINALRNDFTELRRCHDKILDCLEEVAWTNSGGKHGRFLERPNTAAHRI